MGKYDGYLICSDFDGTLAKERIISPENRAAIREFTEGGGLFTIASGRSPDFLKENAGDIGVNAPLLAINGSAIADPVSGEVLRRVLMDDGALTATCTLSRMLPGLNALDIVYREGCFTSRRLFAGKDMTPREILSCTGKEIYKILLMFDTPECALASVRAADRLFGNRYIFQRSWQHGIEMLPLDGGKGNAVKAVRELCGEKVKCVIGVGDYENDIPLVKAADIGIAVANAIDAVKEAADRVTESDCVTAIAEIIHSLPELQQQP